MAPARGSRVILGVDLGSTSTRLCLLNPVDGSVVYVENREHNASIRYLNGDFSSDIYPFDGGPLYLGVKSDPCREAVSSKYGIYVLARASDELLEQYRLVKRLTDRSNDEAFRGRLRQGLMELFRKLQQRVATVCEYEHFTVEYIALSIPAQWTLDFEDIYRDIVATVFNHPPTRIYFHTETVALVHFLFNKRLNQMHLGYAGDDVRIVLFLDFGGHNMNGCIFNVRYGDSKDVSFYQIGEPFGAGGGIEQWEYNVSTSLTLNIAKVEKRTLSPEEIQRYIDSFHQKMVRDSESVRRSGFFDRIQSPSGETWMLGLDAGDIQDAFDSALKGPLDLAEKYIARVSKDLKVGKPQVVVSGGTARHATVQERLRRMCEKAFLPEPHFTDDFAGNYDSVKIAEGAAYATGNRLSVREFLRRGAAFGMQVKQWSPRDQNPTQEWDNTAMFLADQNHQPRLETTLTAKDELKIVCDPFLRARTPDERLGFHKCYDITHLGMPGQGQWHFNLSFIERGDAISLELKSSLYHRKSRNREQFPPKIIPIYFDGGANCVHVGTRDGGIIVDTEAVQHESSEGEHTVYVRGPGHVTEDYRLGTCHPRPPTPAEDGTGSEASARPVFSPGVKPSGSLQHLPRVERAICTANKKRQIEDGMQGELSEGPVRQSRRKRS